MPKVFSGILLYYYNELETIAGRILWCGHICVRFLTKRSEIQCSCGSGMICKSVCHHLSQNPGWVYFISELDGNALKS